MRGYEITSLSAKTQELIQKEGLDTNKDGLINRDNGELANLLSRTGKKDINELTYDSWWDAKKVDIVAGTGMILSGGVLGYCSNLMSKPSVRELKSKANILYESLNPPRLKPRSLDIPYNPPRPLVPVNEDPMYQWLLEKGAKEEAKDYFDFCKQKEQEVLKRYESNYYNKIEEIKAHNKKVAEWKPKVSIKECVAKAAKKMKRNSLIFGGILGAVATAAIGFGAYWIASKPGNGFANWTGSDDYKPVERQRSETEDQFRKLYGEDVDLNEYTPQKGEYWISILKARYGVDDKTAERMAHRIKDVIYNDSLAAKQSPIMYFPDSWTFDGKTYQYNDSAKVDKTENYSDDVKTEMGKMSKDIKYE